MSDLLFLDPFNGLLHGNVTMLKIRSIEYRVVGICDSLKRIKRYVILQRIAFVCTRPMPVRVELDLL